jgi:hypothetical protein
MERKPTVEEDESPAFIFFGQHPDEGGLPIREVEASPLPPKRDFYRCDFCGRRTTTAHQVEKFGPNIVCESCKQQCKERNIPLDLTREDALRQYMNKRHEEWKEMIGGATEVAHFTLAFRKMQIATEILKNQATATDQEWF